MAFHLDKKHWLWIGVGVAGVAGLYLLTHRGSTSSGASAGSDLPQTGPPQLGNMTPTAAASPSFDQGQMVASSLSDRYHQMAQANADNQLSLTEQHFGVSAALPGPAGVISKGWQQIQGGWADLAHPGHNISEQEAVSLGPQNHGPYAKGGGGFFGQVGKFVQEAFNTVTKTFINAETGVATSEINQFAQSQMPAQQRFYSSYQTPNLVPNAPSYGNPPSLSRRF